MNRKHTLLMCLIVALLCGSFLAFKFQNAKAVGTIHISADGWVEGTDKILHEGDVYTFADNIYDEILVEKSDIIVEGNGYVLQGNGTGYGFSLHEMTNVTIKDVQIRAFGSGIRLVESSNNRIVGNVILDNSGSGICLDNSNANSVYNNTLADNSYSGFYSYGAIHLSCASYNVVSSNDVIGNSGLGIFLIESENNTISHNKFSNNTNNVAIQLATNSFNNQIMGNKVSDSYGGVGLSTSNNNIITANSLINNKVGISFHKSKEDLVYHNNLINNLDQTLFIDSPLDSTWDDGYPSGGNYWSDYVAAATDTLSGPLQNETGVDGVGDTSYVIDENNQDNYPLMGMFSDFNATSEHHVQTICNSTVSDFNYNGTAISFSVSGENSTAGFCRMCIPKALMNATYRVFVNRTEVECTPLTEISNITHNYIYFVYQHSKHEVVIIPEFPSLFILPLFTIATISVVILYRRKHQLP